MHKGLPANDPLRQLPQEELDALLDDIIAPWPRWGLKADGHLALEIAAARRRGRPLDPGEPVSGCACDVCTQMPLDHPARSLRREVSGERMKDWERRVESARSIAIAEVLRKIGIEAPTQRSKLMQVCCPLHDDSTPSMSVDWSRGLWFCHACAEGGDGIRLYMRAMGLAFADAVKQLAA